MKIISEKDYSFDINFYKFMVKYYQHLKLGRPHSFKDCKAFNFIKRG
jgi:hypothetical protein